MGWVPRGRHALRSWGVGGSTKAPSDWLVSGCQCPEPCPASASWRASNRRTVGLTGVPWGCMQVCGNTRACRGELGGSHCGDATAKRCTASRITHHVLTPNKVVADAVFVGQEWSGLWSEAAARGMQRESAARSAKRLPCQDSPLDKTPHSVVFVLQRDILRCVYLTIIRCCGGGHSWSRCRSPLPAPIPHSDDDALFPRDMEAAHTCQGHPSLSGAGALAMPMCRVVIGFRCASGPACRWSPRHAMLGREQGSRRRHRSWR
jgi:hypothetical protein